MLEKITATQDCSLRELDFLTIAEQQQILVEWNRTETPGSSKCVHTLFEDQVVKTPCALAVIYNGQNLTYTELNKKANQLAHYLRTLGGAAEVRIGICMERSLEMVIGLMGILKSGAMYVPLDPEYPTARLDYMTGNAEIELIIVQKQYADILSGSRGRKVCLADEWNEIASHSDKNLHSEISLQNGIYVIYTSGSTGEPKGALNTHAGVSNRLLWMQQNYPLTKDDRILQKTPFSFDVSVWELFWPLLNGAALVMAQPQLHRDSGYLVEAIEREGITTVHFVPSMLAAFLQEPALSRCRSLRRVISSGETLPKLLVDQFFKKLPWVELHNL
jgi:microcystin synthetase protein McyA